MFSGFKQLKYSFFSLQKINEFIKDEKYEGWKGRII